MNNKIKLLYKIAYNYKFLPTNKLKLSPIIINFFNKYKSIFDKNKNLYVQGERQGTHYLIILKKLYFLESIINLLQKQKIQEILIWF